MKRLHLYDEENVPEEILKNVSNQIQQLRNVPRKLSSYSKEEIRQYPKLLDYPLDFM